jgi:hypothetical protein
MPLQHGISLLKFEAALTALSVVSPFCFPRLCADWFARIERAGKHLAVRKRLAVLIVGLSVLLRLAILPAFPEPLPTIPDDFSFLLAADTFAHGRVTNPTPAMWTHFETTHVTMQPTYISMYFPGYGLVLAVGQVLFHNPWLASVGVDALMCAALCWMLQAWLPAPWALLGGFLAVLRLGLFSSWINTISVGSTLPPAFAGALVLGAVPRLMRTGRLRYALLIGTGFAILVLTRPYEGMLLGIPVAALLGHWALRGKNRPAPGLLLRRAAPALALILASLAFLGYYDYQAFGSPLTLPYTVDRAQYAIVPYFIWQQQRTEPHYRYPVMQHLYEHEVGYYQRVHSVRGFIPMTLRKGLAVVVFFAAFALLPPLVMAHRVLLDRRVRFLVVCAAVGVVGIVIIGIFGFPHYLSPFTAAIYALGLQAMRHLRVWRLPNGAPAGRTIVRLCVASCLLSAVVSIFSAPLHVRVPRWPHQGWSTAWQDSRGLGADRAQINSRLEQLPGLQLAIVRYDAAHSPLDEWVCNGADLDESKVIWARDGEPAAIKELAAHYPQRKVWLVEPDTVPATMVPYQAAPDAPKN